MAVTVKFGAGNSTNYNGGVGQTVGSVKANTNLQSILGYTSNVDAFVNGVAAGDDCVITEGDVVSLQTRAASKA